MSLYFGSRNSILPYHITSILRYGDRILRFSINLSARKTVDIIRTIKAVFSSHVYDLRMTRFELDSFFNIYNMKRFVQYIQLLQYVKADLHSQLFIRRFWTLAFISDHLTVSHRNSTTYGSIRLTDYPSDFETSLLKFLRRDSKLWFNHGGHLSMIFFKSENELLSRIV